MRSETDTVSWQQSPDQLVEWMRPDWPVPARIAACVTSRRGGVSQAPYEGMNLGTHVGDLPGAVKHNRRLLKQMLPAGSRLQWLNQVHGTRVTELTPDVLVPGRKTADAACVRNAGDAAVVMTADCLPVFFADRAGSAGAVAHAGWRGLLAGVLENTVSQLGVEPAQMLAWLGPAIGPCHFEVGVEVRDAFLKCQSEQHGSDAIATKKLDEAFTPNRQSSGKWMMDIYQVARIRLAQAGVSEVSGGGFCTVCDQPHLYSYRRDGVTGRMASMIWIKPDCPAT